LGGADDEQQQVFNDVASVCFECLRGFEEMLQLFHLVVAKADLDVAMFVKLDLHVAYVSFECCRCCF
jgi:hypothetical protein